MSATTTIKVTDRGLDDRLHAMRGLAQHEVVVGVLADQGGEEPAKGGDGLTVLMVATIHEFGAPEAGVPQRSFVRAFVDEHAADIKTWQREALAAVFAGKSSALQALNRLGARIAGGIQKRIAAGIAPPNAPATVERKGSATPLIATGQLRSSVTWAVRRRGGG